MALTLFPIFISWHAGRGIGKRRAMADDRRR
jgi:hypothetical protein